MYLFMRQQYYRFLKRRVSSSQLSPVSHIQKLPMEQLDKMRALARKMENTVYEIRRSTGTQGSCQPVAEF